MWCRIGLSLENDETKWGFCRVAIAFVWKLNPDTVNGVCGDSDWEVDPLSFINYILLYEMIMFSENQAICSDEIINYYFTHPLFPNFGSCKRPHVTHTNLLVWQFNSYFLREGFKSCLLPGCPLSNVGNSHDSDLDLFSTFQPILTELTMVVYEKIYLES